MTLTEFPKTFLSKYLAQRGYESPTGKPLFMYHTTENEFLGLQQTIIKSKPLNFNSLYKIKHWSACFVLYGSEWYRRNYTNDDGWKWEPILSSLELDISNQDLSNVVDHACNSFWLRPVRRHTSSRNILGTVFVEGGLPYRLIERGDSSFSRVIERTLASFDSLQFSEKAVAEFITKQAASLPKVFSESESVELIEKMVNTLVQYANYVNKEENTPPSKQLDEKIPNWRTSFPIPIDSDNGQTIIDSWLSKATDISKKKALRALTCFSTIDTSRNLFESTISFPKALYLQDVNKNSLTSTRFDLALFEGSKLLCNLGSAYCLFDDETIVLNLRLSNKTVKRTRIEDPISLAISSSGVRVEYIEISGSSYDFDHIPIGIYESSEEKHSIVGSGSFTSTKQNVSVLAPKDTQFQLLSGSINSSSIIYLNDKELSKVNISGDVRVTINSNKYRIRSGSQIDAVGGLELEKSEKYFESKPKLIYRKIPRAIDKNESSDAFDYELDNRKIGSLCQYEKLGVHTLSVLNREGDTLLRRKIGILPDDLTVETKCDGDKATVIINTAATVLVDAIAVGCKVDVSVEPTCKKFSFTPSGHPPQTITLSIQPSLASDPIEISIPYPANGAKAFDEDGKLLPHLLTLESLLGSQLYLYSDQDFAQNFEIEIALLPMSTRSPKVAHKISVGRHSVVVNLHNYKQQILELMSLSDNLDASVRLAVRSRGELCSYDIRRFTSTVDIDAFNKRICFDDQLLKTSDLHTPVAIKIANPEEKAIELESAVEGYDLNHFTIPDKLSKSGPWLIVPSKDAKVDFRPQYYCPEPEAFSVEMYQESKSIQTAVKQYHPRHYPNVIDDVVKLMSLKYSHGSWEYIKSLWNKFSYLPFSTFAAWKSLISDEKALIMSLFILDDTSKLIHKIDSEYPIHWEMISINAWEHAKNQFSEHIVNLVEDENMAAALSSTKYTEIIDLIATLPDSKFLESGESILSNQILNYFFSQVLTTNAEWPDEHIGIFKTFDKFIRKNYQSLAINTHHKWQLPVAYYPTLAAAVSAEKYDKNLIRFNNQLNFEIQQLRAFDPLWFEQSYKNALLTFTSRGDN